METPHVQVEGAMAGFPKCRVAVNTEPEKQLRLLDVPSDSNMAMMFGFCYTKATLRPVNVARRILSILCYSHVR